jgi:hypothetical protein
MQYRWVPFASAAAAVLAALPRESLADSRLLQDTRRSAWALLAERGESLFEKVPVTRVVSPDGVSSAEFGWVKPSDPRPGGSVQLELDRGVALWADWDRYRPKAAQVRETIDTLLVGLQFRF